MKYAANLTSVFAIALSIPLFADNEFSSCVWQNYTANNFSNCLAFATQDIASAQYTVGKAYLQGIGTEKSQHDGNFWISESAKNGFANAEYELGIFYQARFNAGEEIDLKRAQEWLTKAATQGHTDAKYSLALLLLAGKGSIDKNVDESIQLFSSAALDGNTEASMYLADLYKKGIHKAKDDEESLKWQKQAAKDGHSEAQLELASIYFDGSSAVIKDHKEAQKWFLKAAEQKISDAQIILASLLAAEKKSSDALKWFLKAAESGRADDICVFYYQPTTYLKSKPADYHEKAKKWCLSEAENNNSNAQFALAVIYQNGKDALAKDSVLAYKWALISEANKNELSKELLKKWTTTEISEDDRKKAKELVKVWQKRISVPLSKRG